MTVSFITSRKGNANFDKMISMWNWCTETFGKANCFYTWDGDFADDTDDWVRFRFYDESLGTMFKLMYPHVMSQEEFETFKWEHQNDYA